MKNYIIYILGFIVVVVGGGKVIIIIYFFPFCYVSVCDHKLDEEKREEVSFSQPVTGNSRSMGELENDQARQ